MKHHPPPDQRPAPSTQDIDETRRLSASGSAHRTQGQVAQLVLTHLREHPGLDFSPFEIARALGLSHGTVRRHLLRLAAQQVVRRTSLTPARFQITT